MPDTVSLIIWLIGGIAGGFAVGDLLGRKFDLRVIHSKTRLREL